MPKNAHTHEWYCISSTLRFKKEEEEEEEEEEEKKTYRPNWFSGQKGKQTYFSFRPNYALKKIVFFM